MAPSTPPPPSSEVLAAFTMASTSSVVMSATQISSRDAPTSAVSRGEMLMPGIVARGDEGGSAVDIEADQSARTSAASSCRGRYCVVRDVGDADLEPRPFDLESRMLGESGGA